MHVCNCSGESHPTYGACLRAKNIRVSGCGIAGSDTTAQKRWDRELQSYRDARAQGVQPAGTTNRQIDRALQASDMTGTAFNAGAAGKPTDPWTNSVLERRLSRV